MYITVETKDGRRDLLELPNHTSITLLRLLKARGYSIAETCGGTGICAGCHIQVLAGLGKLPKASELETTTMYRLPDFQANSRLACQIILDTGINGIIIKLVRK